MFEAAQPGRAAGASKGWGMLYQAYQAQADLLAPVRTLATLAASAIGHPSAGMPGHGYVRNLTAAYELISRAGLTHKRPAFGLSLIHI